MIAMNLLTRLNNDLRIQYYILYSPERKRVFTRCSSYTVVVWPLQLKTISWHFLSLECTGARPDLRF